MDTAISEWIKLFLQGTFIFGLTVFFLSWVGNKLSLFVSKWKSKEDIDLTTEDPTIIEQYRSQRQQNVQRLQRGFDEKAQEYNERILIPREERKKKKKEEEFQRFLGPAWKGKGFSLGGNEDEDGISDSNEPETRRAAQRRKIPENINLEVQAAAIAAAAARSKPKRVIELPPEPSVSSPEAITVRLRTPLGTICSRRFNADDTVQCLLDYITTQGFSQRVYNISTSYPRHILDDPNQKLCDLGLGFKVALNIEEKDE